MSDTAASHAQIKSQVERRLADLLPTATACPGRLGEAMAYALLAPAKRVRGIVAMLAAEHCGGQPSAAIDVAASIEMVHAASLVLDDLPAMDDASIRRGRSASHRVFGEDTAILAAIALMNRAFGVLAADATLPAAERCRLVALLAEAIGPDGLTGGQELDLKAQRQPGTDVAGVERTHQLKTGALFRAAAIAGAIAAGAAPDVREIMGRFGDRLGLAFQGFDDVLDAHAEAESIGKDVDRDHGKPTVVHLLGRSAAEGRAARHLSEARDALSRCRAGDGASRLEAYVSGLAEQLTAPLARAAKP